MKILNNLFAQINTHSVLIFIAACLFLGLLIYPKGRDIYNSKVGLEQKKIQLSNADIAISKLALISKECYKVKQLVKEEKRLLIAHNDADKVVFLVDQALEGVSLSLNSVTPRYDSITGPYSFGPGFTFELLPVDIKITGNYKDISNFLNQLITQNNLVVLEQLIMKNNKTNDSGNLLCFLRVKFYLETLKKNNKEASNG